ncbi:MFS transporter [Paraburkholderia sp. DHOC27]|uniref:MFS transporter n=1 Tax=Paraburkholderia sp. DHOC27 TaxID=2303330 RepID=UPI000E3C8786|nr:MFS transporter [Paraburkholderia sp. DHOC27]RFU49184.1 MFS transporter [Paraburkholderia sp. DHOC27]
MSTSSAAQPCIDEAITPCWKGVFAIALGAFTLVVTEFLPIGLLPGIIKGLGVSEGTAGLTVTVAAALGFLAAPATVLLVGRLDRRVVLLGFSALVIVSGVMSSLATHFSTLLIARMIIGIGVGGFWSVSITAASRLVPADKVNKASSLVFAGISIASVVSIPAASYIAAHYNWRIAFMAASALAIVVFAVQVFALPRIDMQKGVTARDFLALLKSKKVVAIYLAIIFIVSGQFCGYTFVSPYLEQLAGFDANTISAVLLGYGVLAVVGNFVAGELAGRDLHKTVYANVVLFLGSLIAIAAFPHHFVIAIVSLLCWALSWGMAPVGTQLWLYNSTQHAPEAAQSMNTSVFQLSITLGSLIGGVVVDHVNLHASMWTGAAIFGLAVLTVLVVGRMDALDARRP